MTRSDGFRRPFSNGNLVLMGFAVLGLGVVSAALDGFKGGYLRDDCLLFGGTCLLTYCIKRLAKITNSPAAGRVLLKAIFVAATVYWGVWSASMLQSEIPRFIGILICLGCGAILYPIWLVTWDCSGDEELCEQNHPRENDWLGRKGKASAESEIDR